jgi:hypothetical protein
MPNKLEHGPNGWGRYDYRMIADPREDTVREVSQTIDFVLEEDIISADDAYDHGNDDGYDDGYIDGHKDGYNSGTSDVDNATDSAWKEGYDEGKNATSKDDSGDKSNVGLYVAVGSGVAGVVAGLGGILYGEGRERNRNTINGKGKNGKNGQPAEPHVYNEDDLDVDPVPEYDIEMDDVIDVPRKPTDYSVDSGLYKDAEEYVSNGVAPCPDSIMNTLESDEE